MNKRAILQNLSIAFLAQGVSMLMSVLQTLLVPKVLGIQQFGYWQLYLFYASYVGFFHFGLSSGVYLEMGGIPRDEIDKSAVKSQFLFGVAFQTVIAVSIAVASLLCVPDQNRLFVISMTGIALVLRNAATYMMNVLQCMNETKKSSASTIIEKIAFLVPLSGLMMLGVNSYRPYVLTYTLSSVAQLAYCAWQLRDFIAARLCEPARAIQMSIHSMSVGISLMIANIASMLILGIARFLIDSRWGIETFGKLSLTLSLVNFFLAFVNQAGLVLFPALRQGNEDEIQSFYQLAKDGLSLVFPAVYLFYFPMVWILSKWLPAYSDAFVYLVLLLPICVFDSKMSITGSTYFNVLRKERVMLALNVGSATLSLVFALFGAYILNSATAVIAGMTAVIMLRSLVAEAYLSKQLRVPYSLLTVLEVSLTAVFVVSTLSLPPIAAFLIYAVCYMSYLYSFRLKTSEVVHSLR